MRAATSTFTERHLLLTTMLTILALLVFAVVLGLSIATVGMRAVEMALGLTGG